MKKNIQIKKTVLETSKWKKSLKIFNNEIILGLSTQQSCTSFFIQRSFTKGDYVFLKSHIFQKIKYQDKYRLAHHSREQILKKLCDGE